ncbi:MAG: YihA family ribosome biogenesis GTP-binding protein [Deltaproteobacteria bacterium]|nr:YihA family ribosome biogenesis GTP-binding protein [Deltaproteobacteria bacterium]
MEIKVPTADFLTTATGPEGWPKTQLPEFAFVGRSNVGKSSLINALTRRRKLVRVSNTPGRTRALNFFEVHVLDHKREHKSVLCDLPGYGFAKVSKSEKAQWQGIIEGYLTGREGLRAVVQLIDAEVGPSEQDAQMLEFLRGAGRPVVIAATKLDRLNKAKRIPALRAAAVELRLPETDVLGVSSTEELGMDELWRKLFALEKP